MDRHVTATIRSGVVPVAGLLQTRPASAEKQTMPVWASYLLVFVAGMLIGRQFGARRDGTPRVSEPPPRPLPDEALAQVRTLLTRRRKIDAIKVYRQATGSGLKEAKEAVEAIQARMG
jgi:large subunit ribosomal protein L7/L12